MCLETLHAIPSDGVPCMTQTLHTIPSGGVPCMIVDDAPSISCMLHVSWIKSKLNSKTFDVSTNNKSKVAEFSVFNLVALPLQSSNNKYQVFTVTIIAISIHSITVLISISKNNVTCLFATCQLDNIIMPVRHSCVRHSDLSSSLLVCQYMYHNIMSIDFSTSAAIYNHA